MSGAENTPSPVEPDAPRVGAEELASMAVAAKVNDGLVFIRLDDAARAVLDLRDSRTTIAALRAENAALRVERAVENYVHGLKADHARALVQEEQRGYDKGVKDAAPSTVDAIAVVERLLIERPEMGVNVRDEHRYSRGGERKALKDVLSALRAGQPR